MAGVAGTLAAPQARPPTRRPLLGPGSGVSGAPGRLEVTVRAAALAPPSVGSRAPARPPFTFSPPASPCRSRSEAAMAMTGARAGRQAGREKVTPNRRSRSALSAT